MEINLSPEVLKKWGGVLLIILVLAGGVYYLVGAGVFNNASFPEDPELAQAGGVAAVAGVETFFTLDYEETSDEWLARVCAISTEDGCGVTEVFFLPSIEKILDEKQPKTTCHAVYGELINSGSETDGVGDEEEGVYKWEVWTVSLTLSNPWDGADEEQEIFVQVNTEEEEWKFARILFDQEVEKYSEETVQ